MTTGGDDSTILATYTVGQRLLIKPANVLEFATLIERLGSALLSCVKP